MPGGDVNPYLALAAMLAGGLHGIENELELEPALVGNAYDVRRRRTCRTRCATRASCSTARAIARAAFGDEVVDHYANMADVELGGLRRARSPTGSAPRLRAIRAGRD